MDIILQALQYLAGNDSDYAAERNGVGFNAFDGVIGHDLASRDSLSPKQAELALKILKKYKGQLSTAGIVLPDKIDNYSPEPVSAKVLRLDGTATIFCWLNFCLLAYSVSILSLKSPSKAI